jgi:hypothetical protein
MNIGGWYRALAEDESSKNFFCRNSLPDKGKPAVRRGRKATGQAIDLIAGLPKEER